MSNMKSQISNADDSQPYTLSFKVTGLDEASRYNYVLSVLDENGTPVHVYTGAFATTGYSGDKPVGGGEEVIPTPPIIPSNPEVHAPTGIAEISDGIGTFEGSDGKIFRSGQLIIRRGDKHYTITGQELQE